MKTKKFFHLYYQLEAKNRLRQFTLYKKGLLTKNGYYLFFHLLLCNIIQKIKIGICQFLKCVEGKKDQKLQSYIAGQKLCLWKLF